MMATKTKGVSAKTAAKAAVAKEAKQSSKPKSGLENPYREGSAAAWMFDALVKGGNAGEIARASIKQFPVKPRSDVENAEAHAFSEGLLRINDALRDATKRGLTSVKDGKGAEATVQITK